MRILFILRSLRQEGAGSHQNAISYIRYLKERGHTVTVHAMTSFNNPPSDIRVTAHNQEKLGFVAGNTFLTKVLFDTEKETDIFFLYGVDCIWGGGAYRKNGGTTPVAVYLDTHLATMNGGRPASTLYYLKRLVWEKLFGMRLAEYVDSYIAVSPFIKNKYVHAGFPAEKFSIVPNFFEFTKNAPQKIPASSVVQMLYAGRLTHDKGTDLIIEAVNAISRDMPWHLRLVGAGSLKEGCEKLIQKYKLQERVEIIPWVDAQKLGELYQSADIFVHPSRIPEAFGRTFVEAMSHGVPVIASKIGAAQGTIGDAGLFFESGNVKELHHMIQRLIEDPSLRDTLGRKGITQSRQFSTETVGPQLEQVLKAMNKNYFIAVK